jgi:diguanylate cyclase (GGDEF)-like protein
VGVSRFARDIGWRKRLEGELRHMGEHDWLTDLQNRRKLIVELDRCLAYAARYERAGAVLMLDVDNFTLVNDSEVHVAGDLMLKRIAEILIDRTGDADLIARLGGDEFAIVLPEAGEGEALALAADVRDQLALQTKGAITLSIGISLFTPTKKVTADDVLVAADVAQYEANERGGDRACVYHGRSAETLNWVRPDPCRAPRGLLPALRPADHRSAHGARRIPRAPDPDARHRRHDHRSGRASADCRALRADGRDRPLGDRARPGARAGRGDRSRSTSPAPRSVTHTCSN